MMWETGRTPKGFTLLEITIVILIIGLMLMLTVVSVSSLTGADLRKNSYLVASAVTDAYGRASFSNKAYRLVFNLEMNSYWLEAAQAVQEEDDSVQTLSLSDFFGKNFKETKDAEELDEIEEEEDDESEENVLLSPKFTPVEDASGQKQSLPAGLKFWGIWLSGMDAYRTSGEVYLYFLPGGMAPKGYIIISVTDDPEDRVNMEIEPLTGRVYFQDETPEV